MPRPNGITRQEILTSIKSNGAMTAEELANSLGISQVAVRQHLSSLEAEGVVMVTIERRGLGRPAHRYTLTTHGDEMFPRRYDALACELLEILSAWQGDDAVGTLCNLWREKYLAEMVSDGSNRPLRSKLHELASALTQNGYMACVIEEANGDFQLVKRNCAVYAVACKHPGICCKQDVGFYEKLLGNVQIRLRTSILDGDKTCSFCVRPCVPDKEVSEDA